MYIVGAFTAGVSCDWATAQVAASARVKERRIGEYAHRVMSRVSLVRLDSDHAVEIATTMLPGKERDQPAQSGGFPALRESEGPYQRNNLKLSSIGKHGRDCGKPLVFRWKHLVNRHRSSL